MRAILALDEEIVLAPFGDTLAIVIGGGGGMSVFEAVARLERLGDGAAWQIELGEVAVSLRVGGGLLRPVKPDFDEVDDTKSTLDILLGGVTVGFGSERGFELTFTGSPSVPRCMIGDTGIILAVGAIRWLTPGSDNLPPNTPDNFTGLFLDDAKIELTGLSFPPTQRSISTTASSAAAASQRKLICRTSICRGRSAGSHSTLRRSA